MEAGKDSLRTDDHAVDKLDDADNKEQVPAADQPLQHKYAVWAMMKQQMQQKGHQADSYSAANKIVATFATVSQVPPGR